MKAAPPMLLSASDTRWMKILPFVGAGLLAVFFVVRPLFPPSPPTDPAVTVSIPAWAGRAITALSWAIWGSALFAAWKLKSVTVEGDRLRIGGLRREISVPLHQVAEVVQPVWMPRLARIELHAASEFGSSIWFLPIRGPAFGAVGGVEALRRLAARSVGDLSAPPAPPTDYRREWTRLRLLRTAQIGCLALFLALPLAMGPSPDIALIFIPGIGWIIAGFLISSWPCPRCGQRFFGEPAAFGPPSLFVGSCRHCGLRKGEIPGPAVTTAPG